MLNDSGTVVVSETKVKVDLTKYVEAHQFNFDEALGEAVSNDEVGGGCSCCGSAWHAKCRIT